MHKLSPAHARSYVEGLTLPEPSRTRGPGEHATTALAFDTAKKQAAVVGSDIVSFMTGVTPERRQDIVNSSLLAQLAAKKKVSDPTKVYEWYEAYFDVLMNVGWVVQDKGFAEYHEESQKFAAHEAILKVAAMLLGPETAALAMVETTLDALHSMDASSPWITIFSRESQTATTARFQISLAEQTENGQFLVSLMAFGLEARSGLTQVLFFKTVTSEATLKHCSGKVTIDVPVLAAVRPAMTAKLADFANEYVKGLPDLA
jgi:pyruvoyl-dependent arginine decarboxylase (PvlArgDC)